MVTRRRNVMERQLPLGKESIHPNVDQSFRIVQVASSLPRVGEHPSLVDITQVELGKQVDCPKKRFRAKRRHFLERPDQLTSNLLTSEYVFFSMSSSII